MPKSISQRSRLKWRKRLYLPAHFMCAKSGSTFHDLHLSLCCPSGESRSPSSHGFISFHHCSLMVTSRHQVVPGRSGDVENVHAASFKFVVSFSHKYLCFTAKVLKKQRYTQLFLTFFLKKTRDTFTDVSAPPDVMTRPWNNTEKERSTIMIQFQRDFTSTPSPLSFGHLPSGKGGVTSLSGRGEVKGRGAGWVT